MREFPTLSLQEEFEAFVTDAMHGLDIDRDDLLQFYCDSYLGIAYCDENMEELMLAVVEDVFSLNEYADKLAQM